MGYIAKAGALAIVLTLIASNTVLAVDYIKDAAEALKLSPVYVAPGTEGTDNDTAGKLQTRLNSDDNIVLVMLPTAAEAGTDISTIASRLSQALGNQRIIGLAVGNEVVGYAPTLPAGVAADQMRRAKSVSNDPITALGTFVQNVHVWQREHPQPKPSPIESPSNGAPAWPLLLLFVLIGGIGTTIVFTTRRKAALNQVNDLLSKIAQERDRVHDWELKEALSQICVDITRYFQSGSNNKKGDALFFRDRLMEATQVLAKYIEIQDGTRYYDTPDILLEQGKDALTDFSQYVLASIKRGTNADLRAYSLSTKIMQAQRSVASGE